MQVLFVCLFVLKSFRHPTGGSFIRPNKANFGVDFLSAVKTQYGLNDDVQGTENETETSLVIGRKTVERVGFDSIKEKQKQVHMFLVCLFEFTSVYVYLKLIS